MRDIIICIVNWLESQVNVSNVENFSIAIFGISVTVFTVLYSFIVSKQDIGYGFQEKILNGSANVEDRTNYYIIIRQINKYKQINRYALGECLGSLLLFVICKVYSLLLYHVPFALFVIDVLYILLIIGSIIMFVLLVMDYKKKIT